MRVTFSANTMYYYNTALALHKAGMLERYICGLSLRRGSQWIYDVAPARLEKQLRGRDVSGVDPSCVRPLWMPELLQQGLSRLHLSSSERAIWLHNHLYDLMAIRHLGNCDIFHFMSSLGLYSARRAKARGATLICDQRVAYPDFVWAVLREEYNRLGIAFEPPGLIYDERVRTEHDLADYMIMPSSLVKRTCTQAGYAPEKMFVIPYGAELRSRPSHVSSSGDGKFRILYAGKVIPRKGIPYLVQAFEELALPDAELLLVGPVDPEMEPLLRTWVKNPDIKATGHVPRLEVNNYYDRSSVFVLPSLAEGSALVMYEAMASGLPVIVTENSGGDELVREGVDGFTVPIRDVESLKRWIELLYEDEERRREMGEAARNRVTEFTWSRYGERLISTYKEIASREGIEP